MKKRSMIVGITLLIPMALPAAHFVEFKKVDLLQREPRIEVRKYGVTTQQVVKTRDKEMFTTVTTNVLQARCETVPIVVPRTQEVMMPRTIVTKERVPEPAGFWKGTLVAVTMPITVPLSTLAGLVVKDCDWCGKNPLLYRTETHEMTELVPAVTQIYETLNVATVVYENVTTQLVLTSYISETYHETVSTTNSISEVQARVKITALDTTMMEAELEQDGSIQFTWNDQVIQNLKSKLQDSGTNIVHFLVTCNGCETNVTVTANDLEKLYSDLTNQNK